MLFSTFAGLLLQIVHRQRIKVNWRKGSAGGIPYREKPAGDDSRAYGNRMFRAVCTCAMRHLVAFNTADGEDTALLSLHTGMQFLLPRGVTIAIAVRDFIHVSQPLG